MTDKLMDSFGRLDDDMIGEVAALRQKKRVSRLWPGLAAACLCLALIAAMPPFSRVFQRKGGDDSPVGSITALAFNGAYYEYTDDADILERYGLPQKITAEDAGEHLAFLKKDDGGYKEAVGQTDAELYSYAKAPCRGVLVLRDGDSFGAALFCSFRFDGSNDCVELSEVYRVYGVESAGDIVSICESDGIFGREEQKNLTRDPEAIGQFYRASLAMIPYGNDDWQSADFRFCGTESERTEHYRELAEDQTTLRIETSAGLVFYLRAYPTCGWLESCLTHYRMSDEMTAWFAGEGIGKARGRQEATLSPLGGVTAEITELIGDGCCKARVLGGDGLLQKGDLLLIRYAAVRKNAENTAEPLHPGDLFAVTYSQYEKKDGVFEITVPCIELP